VVSALSQLPQPIAFVLWGAQAWKKETLTASSYPRLILKAVHPSPLSAYRGFYGSKPFSQINDFLREHGEPEIDWRT
jgi:uracil-DNA glycosylase